MLSIIEKLNLFKFPQKSQEPLSEKYPSINIKKSTAQNKVFFAYYQIYIFYRYFIFI